MAPTTRSASQKTCDQPVPPAKKVTRNSRSRKKAKTKKAAHEPVAAVTPRCFLLELPPELRNRIYHFCEEQPFDEGILTPKTLRKQKSAKICKQIRQEFRPLWLRQSTVLVNFAEFESFIATFYKIPASGTTWYHDAPQNLWLAWDHTENEYADGATLIDIRSLLKLRAHSPYSKIRFIARRIAEFDFEHEACDECGQCMQCGIGEEDSDDEEHLAWHEDWIQGALEKESEDYLYLNVINDFLEIGNSAWLGALQKASDSTKIDCTLNRTTWAVNIYLRFGKAPLAFRNKTLHKGAFAYLKEMGILDIELLRCLDFIVGVSTGRYMRPCLDTNHRELVYRQTLIRGERIQVTRSEE